MTTVLTPHHIVLLPLFYIVPAKRKRALVDVRRLKPRDIFMTIVQRVPYDVIP
jgi:hypothetical protein